MEEQIIEARKWFNSLPILQRNLKTLFTGSSNKAIVELWEKSRAGEKKTPTVVYLTIGKLTEFKVVVVEGDECTILAGLTYKCKWSAKGWVAFKYYSNSTWISF